MSAAMKSSRVSRGQSLIAPTKGWYIYDNLAKMPPGTAYLLENMFPAPDYVRVRGGSQEYASGMGSSTTIASLLTYNAGSTEKMFACGGGSFWDVSTGGAVGAADVTGLSNNYWEAVNFQTTGGNYLWALNGADAGKIYDGSSWADISITNVSNAVIKAPWVYKNRIYCLEKDTTNAWYLPVDSIAGAATKFALGGVFPRGGSLAAIGAWSVDSTSGYDDHIVFLSTQGEAAVYSGGYPGATDWGLVGLYRIGKPIGAPRCIQKFGGDLGIMTELGIVPISKCVLIDEAAIANVSVTKPIAPEWRRIVQDRRTLDGWQMTSIPFSQMFVVNIPKLTEAEPVQFVANMISGAWCRFSGWDAACFANFQSEMYWGTKDGRVMKGDTTGIDGTTPYTATMFMSFSDLGTPARRKVMRLARANKQSSFTPTEQFTIRADYNFTKPTGPTSSTAPTSDAVWDTAVWDTTLWPAVTTSPFNSWKSVTGIGSVVAPVWQATLGTTQDIDCRITSVDVMFEIGEAIG